MPRKPDERIEQARQMYYKGRKLKDIAAELGLPEGTIRRWKCTHKWDSERSEKKNERSHKRKSGGQPGNKNAKGGPPGNKKAEKYGLYSKYLPEETLDIVQQTEYADPLDLLWEQIQIAHAAIIRAQRIAYVKDQQDKTTEVTMMGAESEAYEIQQAWDKQANFMKAQARAQATLQSMLNQYDKMVHANWDLVTEEQKTRIAAMKAKADIGSTEVEDDGFLEALNGSAAEDWKNEE